ncbi:glycosyltransferase [Pelagimonas varians]|uniref:glycosyltransferase n=1 Tax=Pelagimonas varians TaxID=696760 RepID=UPI000D90F324|nr:glycosyltransferase [Pelagimonas varians]PYG26327.1 galactose binding lectin-like protein [Pelagimonas varians]
MTLTRSGQTALTPSVSISVIVPVYNVTGHIAACLHSLRSQTFENFEVIVIDDGSTDDSAAIARSAIAGDPRFEVIVQENRGLSGARNTGLDHARGGCIAFVDGDDRVMPDYLAQLWQALQDSGADWVACGIQSCFPDGNGTTHSAIHGSADLSLHHTPQRFAFHDWSDVVRHFPSAWNKLYRRALIEDLRFDEGLWFEDHGFFLRAADRTDHILHLPQPLYLQTQGRIGQITTQDSDRVFEQFDVLRDMSQLMHASSRPGGAQAMARMVSRLSFERSTALKDPVRRSRFVAATVDFLNDQGLTYSADWDPDIARAWGLEISGQLPLSVVVPCTANATGPKALQDTLHSLTTQFGPGREILVICEGEKAAQTARNAARDTPLAQIHLAQPPFKNNLLQAGLDLAQGLYVHFLTAGDVLHPAALSDWVETALRHDADVTQSAFRMGTGPDAPVESGLLDAPWQPGDPDIAAPEQITAAQALRAGPHLQTKLFKRSFLAEQGLKFASRPRAKTGVGPDWGFGLAAMLVAKRGAYVAWPTTAIAAFDAPPPRAVSASLTYKSMLRALPASATGILPLGWQKRLYARVLRHHIDTALPASGPRKTLSLATMSANSLLRGFSGPHVDPAGFDPNIGPRLAKILNPQSLLGLPALVPHPAKPAKTKSPPKYLFPVHTHACLKFRVDFQQADFANLDFNIKKGPHIPLHLSFRLKEQRIICNDSHTDGRWRAERIKPFALSRQGHVVQIDIARPTVRVLVDGQEVFHLTQRRLWRRSGFASLDKITHFSPEVGINPTDIIPQKPTKELALDPRLMLRAAQSAQGQTLDHDGVPMLVTEATFSGHQAGLVAQPSGKIWATGKDKVTFSLSGGSALSLSRQDMADRIVTVCDQGLAKQDAALAALVLEHVQLGNLLPLLPKATQYAVDTLSHGLGLSDYLQRPAAAPTQDHIPIVEEALAKPDPVTAQINVALTRFSQSQSAHPPVDPAQTLADIALPKDSLKLLYLNLSEVFCSQGQTFEVLYDQARAAGVNNYTPAPGGDVWSLSAMLPFMLLNGDYDALEEAAQDLAKRSDEGWILTPPVSWAMRRAQTLSGVPDSLRDGMLFSWMALVRGQAETYWGRTHCREMTRSAVWLVTDLKRTDKMHRDVHKFCLGIYGLSRTFWQMIDETGSVPAHLAQAHHYFNTILEAKAGTSNLAEIDRALCFFEAEGSLEAARLRVELLGPTSSTGPTAPLLAGPKDPAGAAIRHLAFPSSPPIDPALMDLARDGIADLYPLVTRAPHLDCQHSAARRIEAAQKSPETGSDSALLQTFEPLSGIDQGFLGIGLGLSLLAIRLDQGQPSGPIAQWIDAQIANVPALARRELPHASALVSPLARLAGHPDQDAKRLCLELEAPPFAQDLLPCAPASPLYDTVVTVFSCRAYLDDRIPALRASWLTMLKDLGIPYVVVVGDGDGQLRGDVVHLEAPDDYEGLPQKTLAAIKWVHDNTPYAHMLKIDDDCFLNAPLFFQSLSYRKSHYYGRRLERAPGQLDRAWHQVKSTSDRGRFELDKSPEPSSYADGGSGYALSRTAMKAALDAAQSASGQQIIAASFMEDKMLGDLLALRSIHVSDEDYLTSVRRRSHKDAIPVATWLNSFLPSQAAPLQLAHLDNHHDLAGAMAQLKTNDLRPPKIWPSFQAARLGFQSNALELISSEATVQAARDADVAVVACMRNEMFMLPHFLAHYRRLGVTAFLIADNCSDDGTLEYLAQQPDVALFSVDTDYNKSAYGVGWQQAMMAAFRMHKWSLVADADELLVWQENQTQTLPDLLKSPDLDSAEAVRIFMLDMYPEGPLEAADFASGDPFAEAGFADRDPFLDHCLMRGPYCDAPAWTSALRHRLIPGSTPNLFVAQKLALLRYHPFMHLSAGLHFIADAQVAKRELIFGHFKYNAAFRAKAKAEVARGQHWGDAAEYKKYLTLTSEARSQIHDPELSVPWHQSPFVKQRLQT